MEKKFNKGSEEWQMFTDFWALCQRFWIPEEKDEWLDERQAAVEKFFAKYNSTFAMHLVFALLESHDAEFREKRK